MFRQLALDIKRKKTPAHAAVYDTAKWLLRQEIPAPKAVFNPLYQAYLLNREIRGHITRVFYYQPMFRSQCQEVGDGLYLYGGMSYLYGGLRMKIGNNCKISAQTSLVAGKVKDDPTLVLGDNTNLGSGVTISVCERVELGSHVRIANGVIICDNPGHPMDPIARRTQTVDASQVRPVVIEDDVWVGSEAKIMPGVTIGRGSVVASGAIVTRDVPPLSVVAGVPARVIRKLEDATEAARIDAVEETSVNVIPAKFG